MEEVTFFNAEFKRFFRHEGKCVECKIVKQTIERHKIDGDWKYDHTITVSNQGCEYDIQPEDLFNSVEDFEKNLPLKQECVFQPGIRFGTDGVCFYVKDSQVLKFNIDENWRTLIYDGKSWECPELPAKFYEREDVAIANNNVVVVDGNGVETEKVGVNLLIRLNDEQRAILKEIESLFKKAENAGISFIYDRDEDECHAVNKLNVEKIIMSFDKPDASYEEAPIWLDKNFMVDIQTIPSYCEETLWVRRKASE